MSDDANVASNATSEQVLPEANTAPVEQVDTKPPATAREAIDRAFESFDTPADNQPKTDATGRTHGPDGKFLPKDKPAEAGEAEAKPSEGEQKPKRAVPQRFAKTAHEFWDQTPEAIQAEIERLQTEMLAGIEKHKGDSEKYKPGYEVYETVKQYDEIARQSGTTLADALKNYHGIETALRQNPVAGTMQIWQNLGINPQAMLEAMVGQVFGPANGQMNNQPRMGDTPEVAALKQQLAAFEGKFGKLEQALQQNAQQLQLRDTEAAINKFAAEHPYFDDLAQGDKGILRQLEKGFAKDLSEAYENALRLNPEIAAKIDADKKAKEAAEKPPQPDPAQTRKKASLSLTGSPSPGSNPNARKPAGSAREAIDDAFSQLGL